MPQGNTRKTPGGHQGSASEKDWPGAAPRQGLTPFPSSQVCARRFFGARLRKLQEGWVMDFFFFFAGLIGTVAALLVIKKTSPNQHH